MDFTDFQTVLKLKSILEDMGFDICTSAPDKKIEEEYNYYLEEANKRYARYNCFIAKKNKTTVFGIGNIGILSRLSILNRVTSLYDFEYKGTHFGVVLMLLDNEDEIYPYKEQKVNNIDELVNYFC